MKNNSSLCTVKPVSEFICPGRSLVQSSPHTGKFTGAHSTKRNRQSSHSKLKYVCLSRTLNCRNALVSLGVAIPSGFSCSESSTCLVWSGSSERSSSAAASQPPDRSVAPCTPKYAELLLARTHDTWRENGSMAKGFHTFSILFSCMASLEYILKYF